MTNSPASFGFLTGEITRESIGLLEGLPFDALWVGGHVASDNPSPEALVQLARLAALTERVRIGTSILLLPLYPPAIVAKQVADLDKVTGGRVVLGVGVGGEYPKEFEACGVPLDERGARTDEAIGLLRQLWTGEQVSHAGAHLRFDGVRISTRPVQVPGPPIIVAGRREAAMRRAATLGDGWMPYLFSPKRYEGSVARVTELAERAGRQLDTFEWMSFVFVNVQDTAREARAGASAFFGATFGDGLDSMLDRAAAVGTSDHVASRIAEHIGAGARHVILVPATRDDPLHQAVRLAAEVLPTVTAGGA